MHALTSEWIAKAEADWRVANREMRVQRGASYDAVCFHCQQCAEKYLKAFLQEQGHHIPKIHDLNQLLEYCLPYDGTLELHRDLLRPHAIRRRVSLSWRNSDTRRRAHRVASCQNLSHGYAH